MNTIQRLMYVCHSRDHDHTIAPIMLWSKYNLHAISLYGRGFFFQWAEGSSETIAALRQKLSELSDGFGVCVLDDCSTTPVLYSWHSFYEIKDLKLVDMLFNHGMPMREAELFADLVSHFRGRDAVVSAA